MPGPHHKLNRGSRQSRQRQHFQTDFNQAGPSSSARPIPQSALIQAYEAQLIYGQTDLAADLSRRSEDLPGSSRISGRGLIKWEGEREGEGEGEDIWVDRHDILHLLPSLPGPSRLLARRPSPSSSSASASSSWSSLPSDAEDTFFLSGSEDLEEYERGKKRRWMEALRADRLKEREKEDIATGLQIPSIKWEDAEQPSIETLTLMRHTAKSLSVSPNPHLLEMRILTNHSADDRFTFLKGRYRNAWVRVKDDLRKERDNDPKVKAKQEKAVGALIGGYESSDDSEESYDRESPAPDDSALPPPPQDELPPPPEDENETPEIGTVLIEEDKEELRRQRRLRAEEWKRKRAGGT